MLTHLWKQICNHSTVSLGSSFCLMPYYLPRSSAGKESACNAADLTLIPESGRSTRGGIGCPLQYSWASLVTQLVKNLPAMWETWVWSQGWEDPLEKRTATHSNILGLKNSLDRGAWQATVHGVSKSWTQLSDFRFHFFILSGQNPFCQGCLGRGCGVCLCSSHQSQLAFHLEFFPHPG